MTRRHITLTVAALLLLAAAAIAHAAATPPPGSLTKRVSPLSDPRGLHRSLTPVGATLDGSSGVLICRAQPGGTFALRSAPA